jgi:hypothetical protein
LKRYNYFIKRVADHEYLATLMDSSGQSIVHRVDEYILLPIWPAEEYVKVFNHENYEDSHVITISLTNFIDEWCPQIKEKKMLLDGFPVSERSGFVVTIDEFLRDLEDELVRYI